MLTGRLRRAASLSALFLLVCVGPIVTVASAQPTNSGPIRLHPTNNRYFEYKGKPALLITSAEHYGAVLNLDFDFDIYLNTLSADGLNYTRIFTGSYVEVPGSFGIQKNKLAPDVGRFLSPWSRTNDAGAFKGENKWDLDRFNPDYFSRLRDFVRSASDRGIVVEVTLFCSTYQDAYWMRNPQNPANNVNLEMVLSRLQSNTLNNGKLLSYQKELTKKIVTELNDFDNVFYEIQNEPWADHGLKTTRILRTLTPKKVGGDWFKWSELASEESLAWQRQIASVITQTESTLPKKHLIARNVANFKTGVPSVDPNISILNFHYAWPDAVRLNHGWNRPIGFDESGFDGNEAETYLIQAWNFVLAGGAIFNNLDYSFYVGAESGQGKNEAPGSTDPRLRKQLGYLKRFMEKLDFVRMRSKPDLVRHAPGFEWEVLSEPNSEHAAIFRGVGGDRIEFDLESGSYTYELLSPTEMKTIASGNLRVDDSNPPQITIPPRDGTIRNLVVHIQREE